MNLSNEYIYESMSFLNADQHVLVGPPPRDLFGSPYQYEDNKMTYLNTPPSMHGGKSDGKSGVKGGKTSKRKGSKSRKTRKLNKSARKTRRYRKSKK